MKKAEAKLLLIEVAKIDNRRITEELVTAWHEILSYVPYDVALEAHKMARRDATINYLEPRHIVQWAKEAAYKLDREEIKKPAPVKIGEPCPICKHNMKIVFCNQCCRDLWKFHKSHEPLPIGDDHCTKYMKEKLVA